MNTAMWIYLNSVARSVNSNPFINKVLSVCRGISLYVDMIDWLIKIDLSIIAISICKSVETSL